MEHGPGVVPGALTRMVVKMVSAWTVRSARLAGLLLLVSSWVVACGGSTIDPFVPNRVVSFGDESSLVTSDGRKYAINGVTDGVLDCNKYPMWNQRLANQMGVPMRACPGTATTAPSLVYASQGATVATMQAQWDAHTATDTLGDKDLVTMFVGMHDVLAVYASAGTVDEGAMTAELQARGKALGSLVNRITNTGAPVLIVTVPNLGFTPFARAEEAVTPGRIDLLARLTSAFNLAMRLEVINDGRLIGLVDANDLTRAMVQLPSFYGITNTTEAACASGVALPNCSEETLRQVNGTAVVALQQLWADALHPAMSFHDRLGSVAEVRARNNPF
jgi:outer membrane lipase/esterase